MIKRTAVASTNIASIGYDPATETLEIEFQRGSVYQYSDVPKDVYDDLKTAPSIGQTFALTIKGSYPYKRV